MKENSQELLHPKLPLLREATTLHSVKMHSPELVEDVFLVGRKMVTEKEQLGFVGSITIGNDNKLLNLGIIL